MTDPTDLIIGAFIPSQASVRFTISVNKDLWEIDFKTWLGIIPDHFEKTQTDKGSFSINWTLTSGLVEDPYLYWMIRELVDRLMPAKDQLIALKLEYPDLLYKLCILLHKGDGEPALDMDNDTLRFLAEIGAALDCQIYNRL